MTRAVKLLVAVSLILIVAAFVLGRLALKEGAGSVPVVDPADIVFGTDQEPGGLWVALAMVMLLAGLSAGIAALRCWIQNRRGVNDFGRGVTGIIPRP